MDRIKLQLAGLKRASDGLNFNIADRMRGPAAW
jgi:hypothetical protein